MSAKGKVVSFIDLEIWKLAAAFAVDVYRFSSSFPEEEKFGLSSQLRRAAISVSSNIAEGWVRGRTDAQLNHLRIARGSLYESLSLMLVSEMLGMLPSESRAEMETGVGLLGRKINAYIASISRSFVREEHAEYGSGDVTNNE